MDIKLIIWDWNGTLLNDVEFCVETINKVLTQHNLKNIAPEYYREIFTFPVKDYYQKLGFDFEKNPFSVVGKEFIDEYNLGINSCNLYENAVSVLSEIKRIKIPQVIISAREHSSLLQDIKDKQISEYFTSIIGISDIYASSKLHLFKKVMSNYNFSAEEILLIGDTTHDCEIARELNINFVHFSRGHQNKSHFGECDNLHVVDNLQEVLKLVTF
ncbi:MAG: HAD hydrolase-like protein [Bacteroidota bacterium]|nr:HAD hydrolase-like protein [Bacteroidota bacterium]